MQIVMKQYYTFRILILINESRVASQAELSRS